ncbi:MAG: right-handed parallel beta-helix repeat-containing protein [Patescibacteria group bacterium]|nr:right-handed parallel beta-helix repeat-containing protein [Patescibacteria group bacterium]
MMKRIRSILVFAALVMVAILGVLETAETAYNPALVPAVNSIAAMQYLGNPSSSALIQVSVLGAQGGLFNASTGGSCNNTGAGDGGTQFPAKNPDGSIISGVCYIRQMAGGCYWVDYFGVVGDGSTDNAATIQKALTAAALAGEATCIHKGSGNYKFNSTISFPAGTKLLGFGQPVLDFTGNTGTTDIDIQGSNTQLNGFTYLPNQSGSGSIGIYTSNNVTNLDIGWLTITNSLGGATLIDFNSTGLSGIHVHDNTMSGGIYSILVNSSATGSGFWFQNNTISGQSGDGIEINSPNHTYISDVHITRNRIDSSSAAGGSKGFGVGIAGVSVIDISKNTIVGSVLSAIHLEDGSNEATVDSNKILAVPSGKTGVEVLDNTTTQTHDIIVSNNQIYAASAGNGYGVDINPTHSSNTPIPGVLIHDNQAFNLNACYRVDSINSVHDNKCDTSTNGISQLDFNAMATSVHDNYFKTVTNIYVTTEGGHVGRAYISGTLPTTIASAGSHGTTDVAGIVVAGTYSHPGSGASSIAVIPAPSAWSGGYEIHQNGVGGLVTNMIDHTATASSSGSSLGSDVTGTPQTTSNGLFSSATFTDSGGNFNIGCSVTAAQTISYVATWDGHYIVVSP